MGDVVIWNGDPFSVYALAEEVFIDGALVYDRANPPTKPASDFLLGQYETAVKGARNESSDRLGTGPDRQPCPRPRHFDSWRDRLHLDRQGTLTNTDVLIRDGKIHSVGTGLSADNATTIDAKGRALTPGMFAGLTTIGIQEVTQEPTTDDASLGLGAPAYEMQWRPEFDVSAAYNGRSVLVPVTRIEGMTWTVLNPGVAASGNFLAGQGAAVTLDGRQDAVLDGSRSLFIDLGGQMNSHSGGSRAAQWMVLEQAVHETRNRISDEKSLMHPLGREVFARYLSGGRVIFNVDRAGDIVKTIAFAKKYGIKPVIAGGAEAWVVADQLAEAKVPRDHRRAQQSAEHVRSDRRAAR